MKITAEVGPFYMGVLLLLLLLLADIGIPSTQNSGYFLPVCVCAREPNGHKSPHTKPIGQVLPLNLPPFPPFQPQTQRVVLAFFGHFSGISSTANNNYCAKNTFDRRKVLPCISYYNYSSLLGEVGKTPSKYYGKNDAMGA